jgi:transcriptional regulator with GAF, ATPase, and Fis domain
MAGPKNLLLLKCDSDLCDRITSVLRSEGIPLETTQDHAKVLDGLGAGEDTAIVAQLGSDGSGAPNPTAEALLTRRAFDDRLSLRELEDLYIDAVLAGTGGNKVQAARILGINRRTLYRRAERRADREERGDG